MFPANSRRKSPRLVACIEKVAQKVATKPSFRETTAIIGSPIGAFRPIWQPWEAFAMITYMNRQTRSHWPI